MSYSTIIKRIHTLNHQLRSNPTAEQRKALILQREKLNLLLAA